MMKIILNYADTIKKIFAVSLMALIFSGCTTFEPAKINKKTGYIDSVFKSKPTITKKIQVKQYKQMALVVMGDDLKDSYKLFWIDSIKNLNYFNRVVDKERLDQWIFQKGFQDRAPGSTDPIALYKLFKLVGNFLIIKPTLYMEENWYVAKLQVITPQNNEIVFEVKDTAKNIGGLDQPLLYPMLNSFIKWMSDNDQDYNPRH